MFERCEGRSRAHVDDRSVALLPGEVVEQLQPECPRCVSQNGAVLGGQSELSMSKTVYPDVESRLLEKFDGAPAHWHLSKNSRITRLHQPSRCNVPPETCCSYNTVLSMRVRCGIAATRASWVRKHPYSHRRACSL